MKSVITKIQESRTPIDEAIPAILDFLTKGNNKTFIKQLDTNIVIQLLDLLLDFNAGMRKMDQPILTFKSELLKFKLQYVKNPSINFKSAINKLKKILHPDKVYKQDDYYVFVKDNNKLYIVKDKKKVMKGAYLLYPSDVVKVLEDKRAKKHIRRKY